MTTKNRLIRDDDGEETPVVQRADAGSDTRERAPPGARGTYPGKRKVTFYVEPDVFRWLHSIRIDTNRTIVQLGEDALTEFVKRYAAQKRFGG